MLELRHGQGQAPPATADGGSSAGGGGGIGAPAFPESYLESIRLEENGVKRSGDLLLKVAAISTVAVAETPFAGGVELEINGSSVITVVSLPAQAEPVWIFRRTADATLWWDRTGSGDWTQLDVNGLDTRVKVSANDTTADYLVLKLTAGSGITLVEVDEGANEGLQISSVWQRNSSVISPTTAGDGMAVEVADEQLCCRLQSADGECLVAEATGSGVAVRGVSAAGYGGDFFSTDNHGIVCGTFDSSKYSVKALECMYGGSFIDLEQVTAPPATPDQAIGRLFVDADGHCVLCDDSGTLHDLAVQHSQTFPAASGAAGVGTPSAHILLPWSSGAYPAGAAAATVSATGNNCSFLLPTTAGFGTLTEAYARLEWTSSSGLPLQVTVGSQVALAQVVRRRGGIASLGAKLRVNNTNRLSRVELSINDVSGNSASTGDLTGGMSAGNWFEANLTGVDISAFDSFVRIVLSVQGTTTAANVGLTQVDVEYLEIRMWEN